MEVGNSPLYVPPWHIWIEIQFVKGYNSTKWTKHHQLKTDDCSLYLQFQCKMDGNQFQYSTDLEQGIHML